MITFQSIAAEQLFQYKIEAQSLNNALVKFAAASNLTLIFTSDKIRGLKSNSIQGSMTSQQALGLLLKETGFGYRYINNQTITIVPEKEEIKFSVLPEEHVHKLDSTMKVLTPLLIEKRMSSKLQSEANRPQTVVSDIKSATRTLTPVIEIPQSIQVISKSLLKEQGILTVSESLRNISGVAVGNTLLTPSFDFTQIRGFASEQLLDGFTQYYNVGDRESLVNVERIEVLKGSNALLYGGGSGSPAGGLVNIVTKLPTSEAMRVVGVKYGSYQFYQPFFDINQPINSRFLFRMIGEYTSTESHINVINNHRYNFNPSVLWTNNQDTKLILQGKLSSWQQQDYQGLPAAIALKKQPLLHAESFLGPTDIADSKAGFYAVWGTLEYSFNEDWLITLKARYAESEFDQKTQLVVGSDGFKADQPLFEPSTWALFNTELFQQQKEFSIVANSITKFTFRHSEHKILFGGDYSQFQDEGYIESGSSIGLLDLTNNRFPTSYSAPELKVNNIFVTNTTAGGYLQLQSKFLDDFNFLAGVRLANVKIDYKNDSMGFVTQEKTETTRFLPRLGGGFDITDSFTLFVGYSEGMRGQPFIDFISKPEPEQSRHLEAGVKFNFGSMKNPVGKTCKII